MQTWHDTVIFWLGAASLIVFVAVMTTTLRAPDVDADVDADEPGE